MSEMVEIVARALCLSKMNGPDEMYQPGDKQRRVEKTWKLFVDDARCAIEAMREPGDVVMAAGLAENRRCQPDAVGLLPAPFIWTAMIDEALK